MSACVHVLYSVLQSCMLRGLKMEMIGFNTEADAKASNDN